jgi:uncharacterized membrane protein (DUF4010 family)
MRRRAYGSIYPRKTFWDGTTLDQAETFVRLGLALAVGLLIGVERGWHERGEAEGERTAGLRTFALVGLLGGISGLLSKVLGPVPLAVAFLAVAAGLTLFRWRETSRVGTFGATTLVAGFLAFALGAYSVLGEVAVAAAAAVATAALLAAKDWLHAWLRILTWSELRSALILLAMTFVILPVLPDHGFGPYAALNPWRLWLMTIAIAGVSFGGYVGVKAFGERYGPLVAGLAGGLVSSTAVTIDMARRAKSAANQRWLLAGVLAASVVMFLRVGIILAVFGPSLLGRLAGPLAAAAVVTAAGAAVSSTGTASAEGTGSAFRNPLELRSVFGFALLLAVVLFLSKVLAAMLGGHGVVALAVLAGIADVDAITLSMTATAGVSTEPVYAVIAILVAVAVNSLSKSAFAIGVGGLRFGLANLAVNLLALVAGAVVALSQPWS